VILTFIFSSFKLDSLLHYSAEIGTLLEVRCVIKKSLLTEKLLIYVV
jgi:hypothetical protein